MSAETSTQGRVTTEGPEGLQGALRAPREAFGLEGDTPEADEVYRITAHWRPSAHTDLNDPTTDTITGWAATRSKALKLTCLAGTIAVVVHDTDGDLVAHWDGYSNRWHERYRSAEKASAKLRLMHRPYRGAGDLDTCESCSGLTGEPVLYPCPTRKILDENGEQR